jgi:signal transduction histidine kinase
MARRRRRAGRVPRASRISRRTAALAAVCAATVVLFAVLVPVQTVLYGTPLPLSFILGAGLCVSLLLAITHPRRAVALFCGAAFLLPLIVSPELAIAAPWPWSVPALLTFVLLVGIVTFLHGVRLGAFPLVIGVVSSLTAPVLRPDIVSTAATAASATADLVVTASLASATFLIAALLAGRLRIGAELTRERENAALEQSRRALVEERTRIARELHDVIAHSLSMVQVQASTARYRLPEIGAEAAAEFDSIAATARESLTEMRRMLGVLRTEDQTVELAPQQGIADVPALVDTVRRAGVTVGLEITGDSGVVPPTVQIAAFRIAQEALSNAVRHASGTHITVRIQIDAATVGIRVRNAPSPISSTASTTSTGPGHGLRGMRERAELLGGTLTAAATSDGGWEVNAVLPVAAPTDTATQETS